MSGSGAGAVDLEAAYARFPVGFFSRFDETDDADFYGPTRLVTHIDDGAIAGVGALYRELELSGRVLDLMSSWISHFVDPPEQLTVLGMNDQELRANPAAAEQVLHDLNRNPELPFADASFDDVVCCVSVDYLVRPLEVFAEVHRVLRPGGRFVCTFSNRCFPSKAIRGWLDLGDRQRVDLIAIYFELVGEALTAAGLGGWSPAIRQERIPRGGPSDPLFAVWSEVVWPSSDQPD
ncbi:MAG: class I SAM-dependent methyltransferase [Actinomycetota bacterium]|nr:class I SAM-dependent methyltransferase [Actinomycetota bacterium]